MPYDDSTGYPYHYAFPKQSGRNVYNAAFDAISRARVLRNSGYHGQASWYTPTGKYWANYQHSPFRGRAGFDNHIGKIGVDTAKLFYNYGNYFFKHGSSRTNSRPEKTG